MASAYTGHQTSFREMTREQLLAFGQEHAPEKVEPPANKCDVCGDEVVAVLMLDPIRPHVCQPCVDAYREWNEILSLVGSIEASAEAKPVPDWLHPCWVCGKFCMDIPSTRNVLGVLVCDECQAGEVGYAPACGMQPKAEWAYDLMMATFVSFVEAELAASICLDELVEAVDDPGPLRSVLDAQNALAAGFNSAAHIYLASIGVHKLHNESTNVIPGQMDWFVMSVYDYYTRRRYPVKFTMSLAAPQIATSKEPSERELFYRKLATSPKHWDAMWEAQQRWHAAKKPGATSVMTSKAA